MNEQARRMDRRQFLSYAGAAAAGVAAGRLLGSSAWAQATAASGPSGRKPNVLLIFADDLGYGDVGCYGGKLVPTPNIDALAAGGVRFTDGYVTAPVCSPSRAGLLTGRYQARFGHEGNAGDMTAETIETFGLPVGEKTFGDYLKPAGYVSGIVGKWHLGMPDRFHPLNRGFDEGYYFLQAWHDYLDSRRGRPIYRGKEVVQEEEYLTDAFTREGVAFIERHREQPFFLYMSYSAPHTPIQASQKYLDRFAHIADEETRTYAAMVSALDDGVGVLMAKLRELKLEEDTLVFFISDNGAPTHIAPGSTNEPLQGRKAQLLEGGIRVPYIAYWKGRVKPGVCRRPVISLDVLATAMALAGAPQPGDRAIDGANLMPVLTDESHDRQVHDALFWRFGGESAVRKGDYKLYRAGGRPKLYDVANDPGETKDLAAEKPELVQELLDDYRKWEAQLK